MQPRLLEQIPRFGWDLRTLINDVEVSDIDLATEPVLRLPGLFQVTVSGTIQPGALGTGEINMILEGSNTGDGSNSDDWFLLASLVDSNLFVSPSAGQTKILGRTTGNEGSGSVNIGRYKYLRVRMEVVSGTPSFTATIRMTGTAGDAEKFNREIQIISAAGDPVILTTNFIRRPAGAKWLTATAKVNAFILDPPLADGIGLLLEAATTLEEAEAGNFTGFAVGGFGPVATVGESVQFPENGQPAVDMGQFNFFRFRTFPAQPTPITPVASFDITATLSFDDNDWQAGETGVVELAQSLRQMFMVAQFDSAAEPQVGTTRVLSGQFVDVNNVPIGAGQGSTTRRAVIVLSDTIRAAQYSLHPTATASGSEGAAGVNGNIYPIVSDNEGKFSITIDSNGAPTTVFVSCINYVPTPDSDGMYTLVASDQVSVILT